MGMYDDIISQFNASQDQANAAKRAQEAEIRAVMDASLGNYISVGQGIQRGYKDLLKRQEKVGDSQRLDIELNSRRDLGNRQAGLYRRGLGNSTLMSSAERGAAFDKSRANLDLNDALARQYQAVALQKLGYGSQLQQGVANLQGGKARFLEGITHESPDMGMYMRLAQMAGAGRAGLAGAMGGGGFTAGGFGGGSRGGGAVMVPNTGTGAMWGAPGSGTSGSGYSIGGGGYQLLFPGGGDSWSGGGGGGKDFGGYDQNWAAGIKDNMGDWGPAFSNPFGGGFGGDIGYDLA